MINPLQSGISTRSGLGSVNAAQSLDVAGTQSQINHPGTLSLSELSDNTYRALTQDNAQNNGHHELMVLLAFNSIADGNMALRQAQGPDAHYQTNIAVPPEQSAAILTVRARLNEQARYDATGIDLHVPSSGKTESLTFSAPAPSLSAPSEPRGKKRRVPDPENPGKMISQGVLYNRQYDRQPVQDPENPGKMISRNALNKRQYNRQLVSDPENPGKMISQSALKSRKYDRKAVPDPENPGEMISRNALNKRQYNRKLVADPENPGKMISQNALNSRRHDRKAVADPENPGRMISQSALYKRQYNRR